MLRTVLVSLVIAFCIVVLAPFALMAGILSRRAAVESSYHLFARLVLRAAGARIVRVVSKASLAELPEQLVMVVNHESHLDTLVVLTAMEARSIRYIAKRQLFAIPLFGWVLKVTGNISVTRRHARRDKAILDDQEARARDRDILFFPEGTRSRDGSLGAFKRGAFAFAIANRRPILPIAVGGTHERLPAQTYRPRPGPVVVVIGEPISTEGLSLEHRSALRDRCRARLVDLREEALRLCGSPRAGAVSP